MLNPLRIALLVFMATVVLLLVSAMPGQDATQRRARTITYLLVCLAFGALLLLYSKIFA